MVRSIACAAGLLFVAGSVMPAYAGHYDKLKTVTWDIGDGRGGVLGGPANQSKWIGLVHTLADDKHSPADKKTDAGAGGAYPKVIYDDLVAGGAVANDVPHAQNPQPLYKTGNFDQTTINAAGTVLYSKQLNSLVTHASSEAFGELEVFRSDVGAKKQITAELKVRGDTTAATPPVADAPETSYAQATSSVGLELKGKIVAADWNNTAGKRGKVRIGAGASSIISTGSSIESGTDETATAGVTDPIVATYTDSTTGAVLGSSVVYQDSYVATGRGEIHWDPLGGIVLVAPAGSTTQVDISTPSSWVTNPSSGGVGVSGGVFTATGIFASLPWNVTDIGGDITVTLAPGLLGNTLDLDLNLLGLPGTVGDVTASLNSDLEGWIEDLRTVTPSPGSATLMMAGAIACGRRRRA